MDDLDLTKYIILLAAESEVAFFLCITEREDTRTRNERKSLWHEWSHCVKIIQGGAGLCLNEVFGINY